MSWCTHSDPDPFQLERFVAAGAGVSAELLEPAIVVAVRTRNVIGQPVGLGDLQRLDRRDFRERLAVAVLVHAARAIDLGLLHDRSAFAIPKVHAVAAPFQGRKSNHGLRSPQRAPLIRSLVRAHYAVVDVQMQKESPPEVVRHGGQVGIFRISTESALLYA